MQLQDRAKIFQIASIAVAVYLSESLIPKPFPWFRLGLANILVLIALIQYGLKASLSVALTKVIAGSILTGKIFTPFFFFGMAGTIASLSIMYLSTNLPLSIIGISIAGSVSHSLVQIMLAAAIFFPIASLRYIYPIFSTIAIGTGIFTGIISSKTLQLLEK